MTKNEIKYIQSLSEKKNRQSENVFVVEGNKLVEELLASNLEIKMVYCSDKNHSFPSTSISIEHIEYFEMKKISQLKTPTSLLAVVKIPEQSNQLPFEEKALILDGIQDPGNMGTIIRIADWFGIDHIIASLDTADCYNSKVVQATMGGIFRINIHYTNLEDYLPKVKIPIFGALLEGENMYEIPKSPKAQLIIGNESKGIRPNILPFINQPITIPRFGKAESLNAAVATGILVAQLFK